MENNKLQLIVEPMMTISRSAERTINLKNYIDGHDYESFKTASFRSRQILVNTSKKEVQKISEQLYLDAKAEIDDAINKYIKSLKLDAGIEVEPDGDELKEIKDLLEKLNAVDNKKELDLLGEEINNRKDKLNEIQLKYLRWIYQKADSKIIDGNR